MFIWTSWTGKNTILHKDLTAGQSYSRTRHVS